MDDALTVAKYENYIKRRTADSWTIEQENILQMWAEKASGWAWLHDKSARYYTTSSNRIMYPNVFIGTFTGGMGLLVNNVTNPYIARTIGYIVAASNIVCASLTSLNRYLRINEKAEIHIHMNKLFSSFVRKIVLELTLNPENRRNAIEFCKTCKDEYDKLVNDSILIPSDIVDAYKQKYSNTKNKPEVCNGLIHFTNYKRESEARYGYEIRTRRSSLIEETHTPSMSHNRVLSSNRPKEITVNINDLLHYPPLDVKNRETVQSEVNWNNLNMTVQSDNTYDKDEKGSSGSSDQNKRGSIEVIRLSDKIASYRIHENNDNDNNDNDSSIPKKSFSL